MSARMIHPEQWESKFYDDKGKIYVPVEVRDLMGFGPNDTIRFVIENGECKMVKVADGKVEAKKCTYLEQIKDILGTTSLNAYGIYINNKLMYCEKPVLCGMDFPLEVPRKWATADPVYISTNWVVVAVQFEGRNVAYIATDKIDGAIMSKMMDTFPIFIKHVTGKSVVTREEV